MLSAKGRMRVNKSLRLCGDRDSRGEKALVPWRQCLIDMVSHPPLHRLVIAKGNHHDIVGENSQRVVREIVRTAENTTGSYC